MAARDIARMWLSGAVSAALIAAVGSAQAAKDPATRDEDIAGTEVNVDYHQRGDGLWVYEYSLRAPLSNKGVIDAFSIDLRCDVKFKNTDLPYTAPGTEGYSGIHNTRPITPTAVQSDWAASAGWGIGVRNSAYWVFATKPGESETNNRLISAAAPGLRVYTLEPEWNVIGWDYPRIPDPSLPREQDFYVNGVIAGPGCPGEVPPVEKPSFPGTVHPTERDENLNGLLSYTQPLKDRLRVPAGAREVELSIRYRDDLDPKSFKVQPGWARHFFHPEPGTQETVRLPLKAHKSRHRFFLEAHPMKTAPPRAGSGEKGPPGHALKDRDEFEFREISGT